MIEIQNLTYTYDDAENEVGKLVLNGVNLTIADGEFVAVLGRNGSGKSTLAKQINAILLPMGGYVYVDGMDTLDENKLWDIRRRAAMVFQNPDNQIVATIVEEDVAFAAENLGVPSAEIRRRVDDALETVGMTKYAKYAPHLLSGGQKQRIAIAGVIAMEPDIIVFDEPTAMLDPIGRREVLRTIRRLNRELGMTIVLITHNMDEAVMADRVVVMDRGRVIVDDKPRTVFSDVERMRELGLDVPQATHLAYLLRKAGMDIRADILDAEECVEELLKQCRL
ncbi:MAG: energy-coupling factor transporter ATPase [Ruminococcaceae bacterium]|nr:energy-coupling factor transporter ATPase [Oscillospiraceae bacterium]